MFDELDTVVLKSDIKEYSLKKGDMGTIVHAYKDGNTAEVEFVRANGKSVVLLTLSSDNIRKLANNEMLHVREFSATYPM